nr:unknown protein [Oryza sativa Japonica Group]BAD10793.1 unknown protein [Oryza sativa Japonica Group]BAD10825.1 unknown protein [Oryza sativa Japonica Group]
MARGGELALVGRFAWSSRASTLPALCFSCVGEVPGSVELVHETSATQPVDGVWGGVGAACLAGCGKLVNDNPLAPSFW